MTNAIDTDYFLPAEAAKGESVDNGSLGKDAFMKILFTQLQNQDPLNPMEDTEFISQMATFSSLEQLMNMNKTLERFVQSTTQANLLAYSEFVGKEVTWHEMIGGNDAKEDPEVTEGRGVVQSIQFLGDSVKIILEDGKELVPANISEIHQSQEVNTLAQASHLIGKKTVYLDGEREQTGVVASVTSKKGSIYLIMDNGSVVAPEKLTKIE
ncbi:flagellar hook assembly protein FlgD [Siminovitchia sediminis]|uniref:Basal-body rod modification protein FlgD n=1 Tax=Siminovitchia sediminis TaxID=1274353 RepID=A0ABW4KEC6_9BACI